MYSNAFFSSHVGGIFLDSTRRSFVLVLSLFSSYNVIKLLFWFIIPADALNPRISRYILARCWLLLGFLEKLVLKAAVHLKPVFPPVNLGLMRISRPRFK